MSARIYDAVSFIAAASSIRSLNAFTIQALAPLFLARAIALGSASVVSIRSAQLEQMASARSELSATDERGEWDTLETLNDD